MYGKQTSGANVCSCTYETIKWKFKALSLKVKKSVSRDYMLYDSVHATVILFIYLFIFNWRIIALNIALVFALQQCKSVIILYIYVYTRASQVVLVVKNVPTNAGYVRDVGLIPGSERSPGEGMGHGKLFQYTCLENPMDRGAWWMIVHRVAKNQKQLRWLITHASVYIYPLLLKRPSILPSHPTMSSHITRLGSLCYTAASH